MSAIPSKSDSSSVPHTPLWAMRSDTLLGGTAIVLLIAPLAAGSMEPWAILTLEVIAALLIVLWSIRQFQRRHIEIHFHPLFAPVTAFFVLVLLQCLGGFSAYRYYTYVQILLYLSYAAIVFVLAQTLRRESQARKLAWIVCCYGGTIAFLAMLHGIVPNGKIFWIWRAEQGAIYGPFPNHNSYAGFMEMLTPTVIVLAISRFSHGNRRLGLALTAALMTGTIFLSGSRAGMTAFAVQALVLAVLLRFTAYDWKQSLTIGIFVAGMIALLVWVGGNELTRRLASIHSEAQQELNGGMRLGILKDSVRMWMARPVLGWGLGTFSTVFPQFRSFYTPLFINQAHNDYVQLLAETGIVGFAVFLWFLIVTVRRAIRKLHNWTETVNGSLTAAALLGIVGILVHSFFDFNLQIPANALLFYALCTIASADPIQESIRVRRRRHTLALESSPQETPPQF